MSATVPHLWPAHHITRKAGQTGRLQKATERRESNLCASWKSADASAEAAIWSRKSYYVSIFSAGAVIAALLLALWSNWIARGTARRELRAYLGISSVVLHKDGAIWISFKNYGQTPAFRVKAKSRHDFATGADVWFNHDYEAINPGAEFKAINGHPAPNVRAASQDKPRLKIFASYKDIYHATHTIEETYYVPATSKEGEDRPLYIDGRR